MKERERKREVLNWEKENGKYLIERKRKKKGSTKLKERERKRKVLNWKKEKEKGKYLIERDRIVQKRNEESERELVPSITL